MERNKWDTMNHHAIWSHISGPNGWSPSALGKSGAHMDMNFVQVLNQLTLSKFLFLILSEHNEDDTALITQHQHLIEYYYLKE